ncbi:MAG: hypothetical protein V4619_18910, partial [Bacteroidota bacterium]
MRNFLTIAFILIGFSTGSYAKQPTDKKPTKSNTYVKTQIVTGKITDATTGEPLPGASVAVAK